MAQNGSPLKNSPRNCSSLRVYTLWDVLPQPTSIPSFEGQALSWCRRSVAKSLAWSLLKTCREVSRSLHQILGASPKFWVMLVLCLAWGGAKDLARQIARVLDDSALASAIGSRARRRIFDSFPQSRMIEAHAQLYRRLCRAE